MSARRESSGNPSAKSCVWLSRWTSIEAVFASFEESPAAGFQAWARTTAGIISMLLALQFLTGVLLTFYYVPATDHALTTIAYIEKVLPAGSWLRALHHHGSQWLTFFLLLHIVQLFWRKSYLNRPVAWISSIALLALILASGATGYSLPWDARAFFSTRVAAGIAGGLPLLGRALRGWLLGGKEISTLSLSRFFALHVLITPALIAALLVARFLFFRNNSSSQSPSPQTPVSLFLYPFPSTQFARNSAAAGIVFLALALYAKKFPAPLGPAASSLTPGYLPRPGAQFLWLYELLKYVPGRMGSLVAIFVPGLLFLGLVVIPFLKLPKQGRTLGGLLIASSVILIATLTTASYLQDRHDPRTRQQLARQAAEEAAFRKEPFLPSLLQSEDQESRNAGAVGAGVSPSPPVSPDSGPPETYTKLCATCHGDHGQGARQGPLRFPPLLGVSTKPRRTVNDIVAILNDPKAYGLEPPMKSFAGKLTEEEKRQIAEWVVTLRK
jgi:ubiquinol-cytochrome c reductase cytochrome b subunit